LNGEVLAGRYRLVALLGQGGAGQVWRAEDLALGRPVAVKVLRRLDGDPMGSAERFRSEAQAAARLSHPNVVATYDVGAAGGQVYLVMELVAGRDLAQVLREEGPLPAGLVADIAVQGSQALDAAHAAGIVHRDVKPGNLLLAPDGTLKIADFGIAQAAGPGRSDATVLLGTAAYVAPEQVRGGAAVPASDRYALGCVLYELLAGSPPFVGPKVEDVLRQHVQAAAVPIQAHRPDVWPGLADLVMRLLAKDPAARPASAAAAVACLDGGAPVAPQLPAGGHTQVLPILTEPAGDEPAQVGHTRRRPPLLAILAAAAVLVLVIAGFALRGGGSEPVTDAGPTPAAGDGPTPTRTVVKTSARPTPRPTPSRPTPSRPSATRQPPPRVIPTAPRKVDPAALRTLARLVRDSAEGRGSRAVRESAKDFDQAAEALADGDRDKAAEKFWDARRRLAEAQREHRWKPTPQITNLLATIGRGLRDSD
jgi:eukaryotic-like serine/threonine-protein kinase